ncbi:MAG: HAMP domain-containing sensor histidine kinase [Inconstantimicrobium porci]|uniref:sensor histidine kinase n=1 Tax=Inconstantimicrobium porci TaxID=2652291 RepID=UPI002A91E9B1|nr:HAMP domain-containing sensor histidine kinase [Inconstantimicrobium porci]MDY5910415.1 HAMP domain-containing sensor histidine kinase [Inconstantimicrobium porci]
MIEYIIIAVLLIISVYFGARFFLLSKSIKDVKDDFKEICEDMETSRKVTLSHPDRNLEKLLKEFNVYLRDTQKYRIDQLRREKDLRKQIQSISHDLRTPLTSILGYVELMEDSCTEEEKKEYIEIIKKKSKSLQNLIQSFYDLSRLESNEYSIEMKETDIHKILMDMLLTSYNDFEKRNIEAEINIGEKPIMLNVDSNALSRIYSNLIGNAVKYSISMFNVEMEEIDHQVIMKFSNDTDNLVEDDLENLFKRFYMKDKSRNNQSSGLGLTVTKLLTEKMGGEIAAELSHNILTFIIKFKR